MIDQLRALLARRSIVCIVLSVLFKSIPFFHSRRPGVMKILSSMFGKAGSKCQAAISDIFLPVQ